METFPALLAHCEGNQPVTGHHWRGTLMFFFICAGTNSLAKNRDASDLRHHRAHHDVTVTEARKSYWNMRVGWHNSIRNFMIRTYIVCKVRVILLDPQKSVYFIWTNNGYWSMYTLKHVYASQPRWVDIEWCGAREAIEPCWQGNHLEQPRGHKAKLLPTWQDNKTWAGFMAFCGIYIIVLCRANGTICAHMWSKVVIPVIYIGGVIVAWQS